MKGWFSRLSDWYNREIHPLWQEYSKYRRGMWYACDKCKIKVLYKNSKPGPIPPKVGPEDLGYLTYGGRGVPLRGGDLEGGCVYFCTTDNWIFRQIRRFRRPSNPYKRNIGK